jgi:hypothetical protein
MDFAKDRKRLAVSHHKESEIVEKLGSQEFPEIFSQYTFSICNVQR